MDVPSRPDLSRVTKWLRYIITGEGAEDLEPPQSPVEEWLAYIAANGVGGVTKGYYDSATGKFYRDETKTEEIPGEAGKIYFDQTGGKFYSWNGTAFTVFGSGGGASSWDDLTNKPFDTIGEGLGVNGDGELFVTLTAALWGNISGNIEDQTDLMALFDAINALIPAQAAEDNQLADKAFVNSSIGTNTANYISNNGQPFTSVAQLEAYSGTVTNNDYAFVTGTDAQGNTYFDRYKATVSGSTVSWGKEFRLNNSSFTAVQWAAITSGITAALVGKIGTAIQGITLKGTAITPDQNRMVALPMAFNSQGKPGLVVVNQSGNMGVWIDSGSELMLKAAENADIEAKTNRYLPIVPANLQKAVDTGVKGSANYKTLTLYAVGSTTPVTYKGYFEEVV